MENLKIRFDGKIASTGRLHFYEYGRYQYATARFLSTLEHFRRTGEVADKIVGQSKIEIYVSVPQKGSFTEDIFIPLAKDIAGAAVSTPITTLISYVWSMILPRDPNTETDLVKMAEIQLATQQENTKQMEIVERVAGLGFASTSEALKIINTALESRDALYGENNLLSQRITQMRTELVTEAQREELFKNGIEELEKIDESVKQKLISRSSTIASDMAVPIKRSADVIELSSSIAKHPILILDSNNAKRISSTTLEPNETTIIGRVKSYDRDSGVGKIVSDQLNRPLNFSVSPNIRSIWRDTILEAMRRNNVALICHRYVDRGKLPSSLLFVRLNLELNG